MSQSLTGNINWTILEDPGPSSHPEPEVSNFSCAIRMKQVASPSIEAFRGATSRRQNFRICQSTATMSAGPPARAAEPPRSGKRIRDQRAHQMIQLFFSAGKTAKFRSPHCHSLKAIARSNHLSPSPSAVQQPRSAPAPASPSPPQESPYIERVSVEQSRMRVHLVQNCSKRYFLNVAFLFYRNRTIAKSEHRQLSSQ